jgi:hypothetical protein
VTDEDPFARRDIRDAVTALREAGITPDQYATVELAETWTAGGNDQPDRATAFTVAQELADTSGQWVEVYLMWQGEYVADSWIVRPQ